MDLLAETALPKLIQKVLHEPGEKTLTHHLRPSDLIRLIHTHNRRRWGHIFGANQATLEEFWTRLFASEDGRNFKHLHPLLRPKAPQQLRTTIPTTVHEDAAPYGKNDPYNSYNAPPTPSCIMEATSSRDM